MERKRATLKTRIIFLIPAITVFAWLTATFHNLNAIQQSLNVSRNSELKLWMAKLNDLILDDLKSGGYARIRRTMRGFVVSDYFSFVRVEDREGSSVFEWPEYYQDSNEHQTLANTNPISFENLDLAAEDKSVYYIQIKDDTETVWGRIIVKLPKRSYVAAITQQKHRNIMFGLGILLIELAIVILVVNKMFTPLELMSQSIHGLAKKIPNIEDHVIELRNIVDIYKDSDIASLGGHVLSFIQGMAHYKNGLSEANKKIVEQSSLVALGKSTAMIAHDVRKPLTSMKALLSSLPLIQNNSSQMEKMIATVDRNILHTNIMLNDILEFSRDSAALELKEHNPQEIITSALGDAFRNHPNTNVKIEYDFRHSHCLNVDGARIIRVLTNIIDNALDAMNRDNSGKVSGILGLGTYEHNGGNKNCIGIKVSDDGSGISEAVITKIFDPFFTKGKKSGTGLGLAICHRIIELHGGKIKAMNRKGGRGAEITIELSAGPSMASINEHELIRHSNELKKFREEEAARVDYGDSANIAEFMRINKKRGRESYLIMVDDEPLFRESVRCLLNDIGQVKDHIKFIEADSAESALQLLKVREFDYAIVDIDMGKRKMDGYELSRLLLEQYQNIHVIIHSNKRKEEMDRNMRQITSERFLGFLPKPMTFSELLQFLAQKTFEVKKASITGIKSNKNVMILNDDDALLISFRYMLESLGVNVLSATSVSEAIRQMVDCKVDLILSDVNLGKDEPSGYDFLKHVRENNNKTPFYFVSGYSSNEEEPKAKELGADGYFQWPIDVDRLKALLS